MEIKLALLVALCRPPLVPSNWADSILPLVGAGTAQHNFQALPVLVSLALLLEKNNNALCLALVSCFRQLHVTRAQLHQFGLAKEGPEHEKRDRRVPHA